MNCYNPQGKKKKTKKKRKKRPHPSPPKNTHSGKIGIQNVFILYIQQTHRCVEDAVVYINVDMPKQTYMHGASIVHALAICKLISRRNEYK